MTRTPPPPPRWRATAHAQLHPWPRAVSDVLLGWGFGGGGGESVCPSFTELKRECACPERSLLQLLARLRPAHQQLQWLLQVPSPTTVHTQEGAQLRWKPGKENSLVPVKSRVGVGVGRETGLTYPCVIIRLGRIQTFLRWGGGDSA